MERLTQKEMVLRYLEDVGSITPLEAVKEFGIMCLAERIRDLRKLGANIVSVPETSINRYGSTVHYVRYFLKGG